MIFCDTSFLFSLYGNDVNSARAVAWVRRCTLPLHLNSLVHYEFGNALLFAECRRILKPGESAYYWALFEAALAQGRLVQVTSNLADVVDEARRMSAMRTLSCGYRAFDILHVASARCAGANEFLTFDANQHKLAESEGLVVPL